MRKDEDLFRDGKHYAKEIRERKIGIMHVEDVNRHHRENMLEIEDETLKEINDSTHLESTKKVFSNEKMRQAELRKRLKNHGDYNEAKLIIAKNESEMDETRIGLEYFQNMLRLVIAFLT